MTHQTAVERIQAANPDVRDKITLKRGMLEWIAVYSGPHAEDIRMIFNTNVLPTAFLPSADARKVLAEISRLNPSADVVLG